VRSLPLNTPERRNSYWKYPLQLDPEKFARDPQEIRTALAAEGIPDAGSCWPESYEEPLFAGQDNTRCPNAEAVRKRTLMLALPPTWERAHIELCVAAVRKVLHAYRR
jgi:dTDP-4-amino-4,6-dideoxygalactose transaminase